MVTATPSLVVSFFCCTNQQCKFNMLKLSILCSIPRRPATPDLELHNGRQVGLAAAVTQSGILYSAARHGGKLFGKYSVEGNSCGARPACSGYVAVQRNRLGDRPGKPRCGQGAIATARSRSRPNHCMKWGRTRGCSTGGGHKLIVEEIQIAGVFGVLLFTFRWTVTVVDDQR